MTNCMTEFRPDQSAAVANSAIKAAVKAMENAKQNAVLWFGEILERKLFLELGYTQVREVVKVADENNQEDWLKFARENSRRELESQVKRAKKEAADQAVGQPSLLPLPPARPATAAPVWVSMEMSPTQFARCETLWQTIRKQGAPPADKVEAVLEALACYAEKLSPRGDNLDDVSTN